MLLLFLDWYTKKCEVKRIRIINWKLGTMERDIAKNLIESKNMNLMG
ncbi:MAG: hypothetical protein J7J43_01875 [Thermosipho sp. (in: Bacteria)]|nr:hypothetical protein [Thermosipho sp. (in: thermotogales)]